MKIKNPREFLCKVNVLKCKIFLDDFERLSGFHHTKGQTAIFTKPETAIKFFGVFLFSFHNFYDF